MREAGSVVCRVARVVHIEKMLLEQSLAGGSPQGLFGQEHPRQREQVWRPQDERTWQGQGTERL